MIEINNLTTAVVDKDFLKKTAKIVIDGESSFAKASEDKERKIDLSIALVGQERIKKLNKKYRGKNRATDVLSFSYDGSGDIVICLGEVKKNAKRFGTTFKKELAFCLIHGILHLLGYGHEISEEKAKEVEETKVSSSPTELPKEAKVRKRVESSFDFAAARVVKEDKSSFPPSLSPRESSVMEEKQNYYLELCQKVIS